MDDYDDYMLPSCVLNEYLFDNFDEDLLDDFFLNVQGAQQEDSINIPSLHKWQDVPSSSVKTKITIDESKAIQWSRAKNEIKFILNRMETILGIDNNNRALTEEDIVDFLIGPQSRISILLQNELKISGKDVNKFFMNMCIQSGYKVSSTQLFDPVYSKLSHAAPMPKEEYNKIWKDIASKKKTNKKHLLDLAEGKNFFGNLWRRY